MLKSDYHWDGKVTTDDGWDAREVLGRDGHDGHLPPQSVANAKPRREDATRGQVQQEASSTSSLSVWLRRLHEDHASPPHQVDPKGLKVVFIGYELKTKVYKLYDPVGGRAHMSRDIIFDENTFWRWNDVTEADQNPNQFMVEYLITEPGEGGVQHRALSPPPAAAPAMSTSTLTITPTMPPELVKFATPRTANSTLDADHDDGLAARYEMIEDLLVGGEPLGLAASELEEEAAELHAISVNEPNSFVEPKRNPCWLKAMQE